MNMKGKKKKHIFVLSSTNLKFKTLTFSEPFHIYKRIP